MLLNAAIKAKATGLGRLSCNGAKMFINVVEDDRAAIIEINISRSRQRVFVRGKLLARAIVNACYFHPVIFKPELISFRESL
jgi:hypothetical protein